MPAAAIAAELDSRNLRRENRSLVESSFMAVPFQKTNCCYTTGELWNAKLKNVTGFCWQL
jgi:hypothetical protein